jgi:hypothetical protein
VSRHLSRTFYHMIQLRLTASGLILRKNSCVGMRARRLVEPLPEPDAATFASTAAAYTDSDQPGAYARRPIPSGRTHQSVLQHHTAGMRLSCVLRCITSLFYECRHAETFLGALSQLADPGKCSLEYYVVPSAFTSAVQTEHLSVLIPKRPLSGALMLLQWHRAAP